MTLRRTLRGLVLPALLSTLAAVVLSAPAYADEAGPIPSLTLPPEPAEARRDLSTIEPSPELQAFLDDTVAALGKTDPALGRQHLHIALIDLPSTGSPRLAQIGGYEKVYPASVVKFVYLMAAYRWQETGRLRIDAELDRHLTQMIYASSNRATQRVVYRLTETGPGPQLEPAEYADFVERRHAVKRWLVSLGIENLHAVHPTYDGGGDLFGRDVQFLTDAGIEGGLTGKGSKYVNRQSMTAVDTAKLLALLATDRALTPEGSAAVRGRMKRDPAKQPYQHRRISGGALAASADVEVYSKTGTWGPIYADAGIVRLSAGRELVLAVFLDGSPPYRGGFIASLARESTRHLLIAP